MMKIRDNRHRVLKILIASMFYSTLLTLYIYVIDHWIWHFIGITLMFYMIISFLTNKDDDIDITIEDVG